MAGRKHVMTAVAVLLAWSPLVQADGEAGVFGNIGYFYTHSSASGGAVSDSAHLSASLNARTPLVTPWVGILEGGGTVSSAGATTQTSNSHSRVVSGHADLRLFPSSPFPFRFTYQESDSLSDWVEGNPDSDSYNANNVRIEKNYRTRFFKAKQSLIAPGGDRVDGWYSERMRFTDDVGDAVDTTKGLKYQGRGKVYNLYATMLNQAKSYDPDDEESSVDNFNVMLNLFPSKDYYVKFLGNKTHYENNSALGNGTFFAQSANTLEQATGLFYWRPEHRAFVLSGGGRLSSREVRGGSPTDHTIQTFDGNLSANYQINRRLRATGSVAGSALDRDDVGYDTSLENNVVGLKTSFGLQYQSDRYLWKSFNYFYYANTGVGVDVDAQYEDWESYNSLSASAGHTLHRSWVTGNRSRLRLNLRQAASKQLQDRDNSAPANLNHGLSLYWNDSGDSASTFAQASALDSRSFGEDRRNQIVTLQLSRTMPLSRLSSWGGHVTSQSSRQTSEVHRQEHFLTSITGRLHYQHARLFGIYKLRFKAKMDVLATENRTGGDRRQGDMEGRFSYRLGLLNTALIYRQIVSEENVTFRTVVFQVNRSF